MTTGLHESTLALSVYNAMARYGIMSRAQALAALQRDWEASVEPSEVDTGVAYLMKRKLITEADGVLKPARIVDGAAATVVRHPLKQTELVYTNVQKKIEKGTVLG